MEEKWTGTTSLYYSAAAVTADAEHLPMLLQDVRRQAEAGATRTDVSCISVTLQREVGGERE